MWGTGELGRGGQKAQNCNYKINKYEGRDVQHDDCSWHWCVIYKKDVMRINSKSSHHEGNFSLYSLLFLLYLYDKMDVVEPIVITSQYM